MKKLILFIAFILIGFSLFAQRRVDADVVIVRDSIIMTSGRITDMADGVNLDDAATLGQLISLIGNLNLTTTTDPATDAAVSTAIVDEFNGVVITLTTDGNDQEIQQPTLTSSGKEFVVMNSSASTHNISIIFDNDQTKLLQPGQFNTFTYDMTEWTGNNITSVTTTNINGTGLFEGGILDTITGDNATFNIGAGDGIIIDNTTDHEKPNITYVEWSAFLDQTPSFLNTEPRTYIGIDVNGAKIEQSADFTNSQKRSLICLGSVGHPDETNITSAINTPVYAIDRVLMPVDLASAIGNINAGNSYSGVNATNTLNKTSGATFRLGANYVNDTSNPNETTDPAINPVGFVYVWGDGVGGLSFGTGTTAVSGTLYDDGSGTPASVPSNKFTNQRIFYFPGTNLSFIILGQNVYNTLDAAVLAAPSENFSIPVSQTEGASARSIISIRNNLTTFTDPNTDLTTYKFTELSKFGEISTGGSAGATDLQTAYNNSVQPQITIDSGRGALQVKSGTGDDADNVQEWLNNASDVVGEIDGDGNLDVVGQVTAVTGAFTNDGQSISVGGTSFISKYINFRPASAAGVNIGLSQTVNEGNGGFLIQSGTGKNIEFWVDGNTTDFTSGTKVLSLDTDGSATFSGNATAVKYFVSTLNTAPSSATDTGTTGEIRFTTGYIYLCISTNVWVRTQLTTW